MLWGNHGMSLFYRVNRTPAVRLGTFSGVISQANAVTFSLRGETGLGLFPDLARLPLLCVPQPPEQSPSCASIPDPLPRNLHYLSARLVEGAIRTSGDGAGVCGKGGVGT